LSVDHHRHAPQKGNGRDFGSVTGKPVVTGTRFKNRTAPEGRRRDNEARRKSAQVGARFLGSGLMGMDRASGGRSSCRVRGRGKPCKNKVAEEGEHPGMPKTGTETGLGETGLKGYGSERRTVRDL